MFGITKKIYFINDDIFPVIANWVLRIGAREAVRRLILSGLSPKLAQNLITGHYAHALRFETREMILNAIRREAV